MRDFSLILFVQSLLLAVITALGAWRLGLLSINGLIAASLLGGIVYGLGGLEWAILLISFFLSSSLLSKSFSKRKKKLAKVFAKGGQRDWAQVAANGGVGAIVLLMNFVDILSPAQAWLAFAASLAAVNADTWATELGVLSSKAPRMITNGRQVPAGTSGAVSLVGNAAALSGALLIGGLGTILMRANVLPAFVWMVTLAGFSGAMIDSWLGASVQVIYFCPKHEKETEQFPLHYCGSATEYLRGWRWMSNDWVNFLSAAGAALLALMLMALVG